jgi:hypothetical protein
MAIPAPAAPGGQIGMLMVGRYDCELPGEVGGAVRRPDAKASFSITSSSIYIAADGSSGSYLKTGKIVQMTSGPLAGTRFKMVGAAFLRRIEANGQPGALRCVLNRATDSS